MADKIKLTIDGHEVTTQKGKTVIQAAMDAGLYVPYLCYWPTMKPYGACRMCVVEIEKMRGFPASCTTDAAEGMVVHTNTSPIQDLRKGVMELLLSEHPHGCLTCHRIELCGPQDVCLRHVSVNDRCVTCPKNERCELKDTARLAQVDLETPLAYHYRDLPIEVGDPFYDRDYNLCIVCMRCVRACEELRGDNAITMVERSGRALVGTSHGTSLLESGCEFCGACIDVCPTGALVERDRKWEKAVRKVNTICPHCPVGCEMTLEVNRRGKVIRSVPYLNGPANAGQACFKGKFGMEFVNHRQRLTKPLVRRNGDLEETSWEETLGLVVNRLKDLKGPQFAAIGSPRNTNEEQYLLQKFTRTVMGSNNVDCSSNLWPGVVEALRPILGCPAATNSILELEKAKAFLCVNTNITEEHNVIAVPIKRAARKGASLIVIDPREVELARYAKLWLRPRPGTEAVLLGGLLRSVFDQGLADESFLRERCENVETLKRSLEGFQLDKVSRETGVRAEDIAKGARLFGELKPGAILYALDNVPTELHEPCVQALSDIALATGNLGKPSAGLFPLRTGANQQGAWDVGCAPHLLPGFRSVDDPDARAEMQALWESEIPSEAGWGVKEALDSARDGRLKAMVIWGDSPHFYDGELEGVAEALESLEFLVVMDAFLPDIARYAHVVLPAVTFAEKEGTYTNTERRVQLLRQVIERRGEAREEWRVFAHVAHAMGGRGFNYSHPSQIMEEIARVVPFYRGVSYERLEGGSLQWPCPEAEHTGTPALYHEAFNGGKAHLAPVEFRVSPPATDEDHPFLYAPGRVLEQPEREIKILNAEGRNLIQRDELLEIHPEDARKLGVKEGDTVEVVSAAEQMSFKVSLSDKCHRGVVSATFLFADVALGVANCGTSDPMLSNSPTLKITAARIERIRPS